MRKGPKGRKGRKVEPVMEQGDMVEVRPARGDMFTAIVIQEEDDQVRILYKDRYGREIVTTRARSEVGLEKDEIPW